MQAAHIDRVLDLNPEKVKQCMDAGLLQYRKRANLYDDQTMKIEFNCEDVIRRALEKYGA